MCRPAKVMAWLCKDTSDLDQETVPLWTSDAARTLENKDSAHEVAKRSLFRILYQIEIR